MALKHRQKRHIQVEGNAENNADTQLKGFYRMELPPQQSDLSSNKQDIRKKSYLTKGPIRIQADDDRDT